MPSNRERLYDLAERYGLGPVSFCHSALQSGKFIATVRVGRRTFPSYPAEFATPTGAEEECARQAMEYYLKWLHEQSLGQTRVQLPETTDLAMMANRILDIVRPHPSGCWGPSVAVKYSRVYGERLPDNWTKLIQQVNKEIVLTPGAGGHFLVHCQAGGNQTERSSPASLSTTDSSSTRQRRRVPDTWLVHVLAIMAGDRVSIRRIDTKEYEEWEKLAAIMDSFYRSLPVVSTKPVDRFEPGLLYAALIESCWLRVKFIDYLEDGTLSVLLVDFADMEKVSADKLRPLEERFVRLPPQGVVCHLEGLAPVTTSKAAVQALTNRVLNKVLIARINPSIQSGDGVVSAVLYESTDAGERDMNKWIAAKAVENIA